MIKITTIFALNCGERKHACEILKGSSINLSSVVVLLGVCALSIIIYVLEVWS